MRRGGRGEEREEKVTKSIKPPKTSRYSLLECNIRKGGGEKGMKQNTTYSTLTYTPTHAVINMMLAFTSKFRCMIRRIAS